MSRARLFAGLLFPTQNLKIKSSYFIILFAQDAVLSMHFFSFLFASFKYATKGAPNGRIRHRCTSLQAEYLRHVWSGEEQCPAMWDFSWGRPGFDWLAAFLSLDLVTWLLKNDLEIHMEKNDPENHRQLLWTGSRKNYFSGHVFWAREAKCTVSQNTTHTEVMEKCFYFSLSHRLKRNNMTCCHFTQTRCFHCALSWRLSGRRALNGLVVSFCRWLT